LLLMLLFSVVVGVGDACVRVTFFVDVFVVDVVADVVSVVCVDVGYVVCVGIYHVVVVVIIVCCCFVVAVYVVVVCSTCVVLVVGYAGV